MIEHQACLIISMYQSFKTREHALYQIQFRSKREKSKLMRYQNQNHYCKIEIMSELMVKLGNNFKTSKKGKFGLNKNNFKIMIFSQIQDQMWNQIVA